ncbi:MAG: OmpH family outer membrane protein [Porphyromonadaceae bacterium]|nr:OmpH family outer membrane protein [Porphyromonadaceae bacterium]
MIKKFFILVFLALPMGLFAQTYKFGIVNTVEVFNLMPEKATAEQQLEALSKQYENEFAKMQEEFTTKYKEFVNSQDSMPENIKQRRMQEIQEIQQRIQNFREVATNDLEDQQSKLLAPLQEKISTAVQAVGSENGFTFIFDMSIPAVLYAGGEAIDATPLVKAKLGL